MRTLRQRLVRTLPLAASTALAACAGAPMNAALLPARSALVMAPSAVAGGEERASATVSSVGRAEIAPVDARMYSNLAEMLNGRIAGLEVLRRGDGSFSLRVRGARSFTGDAEPLVVVDGMMYGSTSAADLLSVLSPRDVKRVDVLKDAGATAVYGSRGANGVVLITTRPRS